eukprot:2966059-Prymnesium_polylepis.2
MLQADVTPLPRPPPRDWPCCAVCGAGGHPQGISLAVHAAHHPPHPHDHVRRADAPRRPRPARPRPRHPQQ